MKKVLIILVSILFSINLVFTQNMEDKSSGIWFSFKENITLDSILNKNGAQISFKDETLKLFFKQFNIEWLSLAFPSIRETSINAI